LISSSLERKREQDNSSCRNPRIYITLVLIFSTKSKKLKDKIDKILSKFKNEKLLQDQKNTIKQEFEHIYNIAYKFFYNDFYLKNLKIEYLGYSVESSPQELEGKVRLDYVLVKNHYHNVYSLHIHFIFEKQNFNWNDKDDAFLEKISRIYGEIYINYQSKPENIPFNSLRELMKLNGEEGVFKHREFTYPVTFYTYISVCNLNEEQIRKWEDNYINIYRLLILHPKGIDESKAKSYLNEYNFSTANFYRNFFQPGGMVSISAGFPKDIYYDHCETLLPSIDSGGNVCSSKFYNERSCKLHIDNNGKSKYNEYDLIAEYPPLRYLGLLSLEFSGFIEENLRYMYEELLNPHKNKLLIKFLKYILFPPSYLNDAFLFYRNLSLEPIRLPEVRNYIDKVIDSKKQVSLEKATENIGNAIINILISTMTLILLILTFILLFRH